MLVRERNVIPQSDDEMPEKVKPAFCSTGELFGGVERQLLDLCTYWLRKNSAPLLILFHDRELAAQARNIGVDPVIIPTRHKYDPGGAWHLAKVLAESDINVVHADRVLGDNPQVWRRFHDPTGNRDAPSRHAQKR